MAGVCCYLGPVTITRTVTDITRPCNHHSNHHSLVTPPIARLLERCIACACCCVCPPFKLMSAMLVSPSCKNRQARQLTVIPLPRLTSSWIIHITVTRALSSLEARPFQKTHLDQQLGVQLLKIKENSGQPPGTPVHRAGET